jgi:hypothetical protein
MCRFRYYAFWCWVRRWRSSMEMTSVTHLKSCKGGSFQNFKAMQNYARQRSVNDVNIAHMAPMQEIPIMEFLTFMQNLGVWSLLHQADSVRTLKSALIRLRNIANFSPWYYEESWLAPRAMAQMSSFLINIGFVGHLPYFNLGLQRLCFLWFVIWLTWYL